MLGVFRFILALLVVITHLYYPSWFGHYAVIGFYILSGYLMTSVLGSGYERGAKGIGRFFINRFLRIYPPYFVALMVSIVVIFFFKDVASGFNEALKVPSDLSEWVVNFVIFGMPNDYESRLIPPAWALANELVFYVLIGLGLSASKKISWIWFLASCCLVAWSVFAGFSYESRYFTVYAASLPFAMGAMLAHYKMEIYAVVKRVSWRVIAVFAVYVFVAPIFKLFVSRDEFFYFFIDPHLVVYYLAHILMFIIVARVMFLRGGAMIRNIDSNLGSLSYPIYLLHWQVAVVVSFFVYGGPVRPSIVVLVVSVPVIIIVSWLMVVLVDRPIDKLRSRVKG